MLHREEDGEFLIRLLKVRDKATEIYKHARLPLLKEKGSTEAVRSPQLKYQTNSRSRKPRGRSWSNRQSYCPSKSRKISSLEMSLTNTISTIKAL